MGWVSTPLWKIRQICVPSASVPILVDSSDPLTRSVGGDEKGNGIMPRKAGFVMPSIPLIRPNIVSYTPPISSCMAFSSSGIVTAGCRLQALATLSYPSGWKVLLQVPDVEDVLGRVSVGNVVVVGRCCRPPAG